MTTPIKPTSPPGLSADPSSAPMRGAMRLNPSRFGARAASAPGVSVQTIQEACLAIDRTRYVQLLRTIENKESQCAAASYSIDDQRAAGCSGTDTVDQCQTRLYAYCLDRGGDRTAFKNAANQELAAVRRVRDMLEAYARYVENTLPLHSGDATESPSPPRPPHADTLRIR